MEIASTKCRRLIKPIMFELPVHGAESANGLLSSSACHRIICGYRAEAKKGLQTSLVSHLQAFFIVTSERRPVAFVGFFVSNYLNY
ncbi:hypothetical protein VQ056_03765 [Paenibacillus sp. JTLBN-2024]